jgi:hypothetical protein
MPDHEAVRLYTRSELDAMEEVTRAAVEVALTYARRYRDPSEMPGELVRLANALLALGDVEQAGREEHQVEREREVAALEQRFGAELWD